MFVNPKGPHKWPYKADQVHLKSGNEWKIWVKETVLKRTDLNIQKLSKGSPTFYPY